MKSGRESFAPVVSSAARGHRAGTAEFHRQPDSGLSRAPESRVAPASVADTLRNGTSQPVPRAIRRQMERGFGHDFSHVRLHTDAAAAESAGAVGAAAYTVGSHVVFAANRFSPFSPGGQRLLAHELAHVVQQGGFGYVAGAPLRIGTPGDALERDADHQAAAVLAGRPASGAPHSAANGVLQRSPPGTESMSGLPGMNPALASVEFKAGEPVTGENPKIASVAQSYKANAASSGRPRVRISAYLPEAVKYNSADEQTMRSKLGSRMQAVRAALLSLGVPAADVDISPASAYASSANGQVFVDVSRQSAANPLLTLPALTPSGDLVRIPPAAGGLSPSSGQTAASPKTGTGAKSALPALDLDVKIGPVTVSLPKEVRAKLPIALSGAKSLVIDLAYEVPAKFSLKIALDGTPYVRVSLKAGAEIATKNKSATASAGLVIETVATTARAVDPAETQAKIKKAGDALNKAAQELSAAKPDEKFEKAIDVASAIGEMYDAVDKASKSAKPVPRASFEFGYKRLLTPGDEADPRKLPPLDYAGVTATFRY